MDDKEKNVIDLLKNIDKQKCLMLNCPVVKNNIERQLKIIELNRIIRKQSKEIEELQAINQMQKYRIEVMDERELISRDEVEEIIKTRIKEIQNMYDKLSKNPKEHLHSKTEYLIVICELQSILNEIKGDDK